MTKTKPTLNHAPVHLPAGSYDFQALRKGLDDAAKAAPEDRAAAIVKAAEDAAGGSIDRPDLSLRPDQKLVEVEHPTLGIKEKVRVYDAGSEAAKQTAAASDAEADRRTKQAAAIAARAAEPAPEVIPDQEQAPSESNEQEG